MYIDSTSLSLSIYISIGPGRRQVRAARGHPLRSPAEAASSTSEPKAVLIIITVIIVIILVIMIIVILIVIIVIMIIIIVLIIIIIIIIIIMIVIISQDPNSAAGREFRAVVFEDAGFVEREQTT